MADINQNRSVEVFFFYKEVFYELLLLHALLLTEII